MKQTIFTLFLFSAIALVSCRKNDTQLNIKQYDQQQIQNYIAANHLTGFVQDSTGGDTSGIYYKVLQHPNTSNPPIAYSDNIAFVFTLKSFDGIYVSGDTIANHYQGYAGHIVTDALPYGLELAIINDLKYYGGSIRILIPSHLAYGVAGYGTGSIENKSSHIAGNQCLDYYVHVINAQHDSATSITAAALESVYDYQVINNYLNTNSLAGEYTLDSGVYYRIVVPGKGTDPITANTTATLQSYGRLLNNLNYENNEGPDSVGGLEIPNLIPGVQRMLKKHAVQGTTISMILPSQLGFGTSSSTETLATVPPNSCLRIEYTVVSLSP
jgi:FKBP-type peptidyl-prolyl cis-trans isomerase FkpA